MDSRVPTVIANFFGVDVRQDDYNVLREGTYEPPRVKTNKMSVCPAKTQISLGIRLGCPG